MRKMTKLLLGIFFAGVLLGGIGVGVAFVEYSSLEYLGSEDIGSEYVKTEKVTFTVREDTDERVILDFDFFHTMTKPVVYDGSLLENTVVCEVTYNGKLMQLQTAGRRMEGKPERYTLYMSWKGEEINFWMEKKDEILKNLKDGKFHSYHWDDDITVKVKAHPGLEGRLVLDD